MHLIDDSTGKVLCEKRSVYSSFQQVLERGLPRGGPFSCLRRRTCPLGADVCELAGAGEER